MQQRLMDIYNPTLVIVFSPLLFILILCISTVLFPMFIHQSIVLIMRLLQRTYSKLGFGLDLLVNGTQLDSVPDNLKFLEELGITPIKCSESDSKDKEDVDCAVCLCKIEAGEEVRELRCEHLFHRVCLDRWVGFQRYTCPLCRDSLAPRRVVSGIGDEQGFAEEVILKFTSVSAYFGRCRWWLRNVEMGERLCNLIKNVNQQTSLFLDRVINRSILTRSDVTGNNFVVAGVDAGMTLAADGL
ncbi:hypothetical protein NE237_008148 [Protea cynaroides]|uniref:RING-type domain-containing protein n=1 Tax=Protea cynaroides TaxID=273540 RepID=A0A9Q0KQU8_9MAGN|nr:hypothetical protein NE237_008148 [Protea cynaroides]